MIVSTKAIVISTIKYGDTSLIAKCFTQSDGLKTYLLKGIRSSKKAKIKAAYFQPLSQLHIVANHRNKGTMESIKEVRVSYHYKTLYADIRKNAIAFFLSEVMSTAIQEETSDTALFEYLETSLQWLDVHDKISNFHILFMINLTKYFGFYPETSNKEFLFFNLTEGEFSSNKDASSISGQSLTVFNRFLGIKFDEVEEVKLSKADRQSVINTLILYFKLHLQGFKKPKSLAVLNEVFN